jgi:glycosyltransferase involved in cell wall biosynthesis
VIRRFNPRLKLSLQMRCEWLNQLDRSQLDRNLRSIDTVIGCSEYITNRAAERFPDATTRFMTIYNGIDTKRFAYEPEIAGNGGKQVLYMGRLSPEKGVHTLVEAFAMAHRADPELRLCLVGGQRQLPSRMLVDLADDPLVLDLKRYYTTGSDGEYIAALRGMIRDHGLSAAVQMPGNIPYDEVVAYYRSATMLVNPSLSESFGRGPAEAGAIGLPVIASTACGLPEIVVDGETGLLVPPEQPGALAEAILRLSNDSSLRRELSVAAQQRVEARFSWSAVSAEVAAHCHASLAKGRS